MRFDDRLLTVLNQPAGDRHDAAVRWRQLVDLVARAGPNSASPVVARGAGTRSAPKPPTVDERLRAAAARAVAALPLPLGLLEYFASDRLAVSAPVLAAATLDPAQWRALLRRRGRRDPAVRRDASSRACDRARRRPTAALPRASAGRTADGAAAGGNASAGRRPSLSDVVARIERRRRSRASQRRAVAETHAAPERRRCSAGNAARAAKSPGSTARRAAR